jgi:uncharacterized protein (DUF433 family)
MTLAAIGTNVKGAALASQELAGRRPGHPSKPTKRGRIRRRQAINVGVGATPAFEPAASEPAMRNGQPCIRGTRLTVRRVRGALATYPDRRQFLAGYPEIEDEDWIKVFRAARFDTWPAGESRPTMGATWAWQGPLQGCQFCGLRLPRALPSLYWTSRK